MKERTRFWLETLVVICVALLLVLDTQTAHDFMASLDQKKVLLYLAITSTVVGAIGVLMLIIGVIIDAVRWWKEERK